MSNLTLGITLYSDWFKNDGDPDDPNPDDDKASPGRVALILGGTKPLPPNAIIQYSVKVDPTDTPHLGDLTVHWVTADGRELHAKANTQAVPYEGASGKVKPGKFNNNHGYDGLVVTYAPDAPTSGSLWVTSDAGDKSKVVEFPWVAKPAH